MTLNRQSCLTKPSVTAVIEVKFPPKINEVFMKKLAVAESAAVLLAGLAGCSTQTYIVSNQTASQTASYDKMQHFFVGGIGQQSEKDTKEVCPNGSVAKVQTQQTFLNGFLGAISYGIYSPRDMRIYCK